MNGILPDGIDLEWSHCRPLSNEQPKYIRYKMCPIKKSKKIPCCWARHSSCRVWSGEGWPHSGRRGGRPCQDSWKPRWRSPTTSSSVRSRWTAGTGWNDWHEYFYGLIVILIFQEFLWLLVTLDSGNMAERLRFLPQKHWGKKQKLPKKQNKTKYKKQNTRHKIQNFSTCVRSGDSDGIARWRRLKSGEANPWWLVWGWEKRSSKYYIFIHVPDIYTKKRKWKVHIIWNPGNTLPPPLYAYA